MILAARFVATAYRDEGIAALTARRPSFHEVLLGNERTQPFGRAPARHADLHRRDLPAGPISRVDF